ncbi:Multiple coagulation factor deficiency protein 2-like protein [Trichoplax sp. H2]|uniref:EF-hand domain-containing protein n=1 Tax=Trichoplax adhaerens TaxID=10228 RepID=B3S581_TRIAD|nr:hypothetical protein TRIADDRAFT_59230 [Trichoplax adhaerens]EDV22091.1 hypothetical protein TRIADDRAFT_59230 [Trichoplax adhaerens]RDD46491.1 Multiple coagulation factor deficiency protein 2-like protein [Trichoplax sp. H2]|eukprot:XP_002115246.1 hypothetical protein TRIADDRAFT_59230 [Trichoplax adhaerens]
MKFLLVAFTLYALTVTVDAQQNNNAFHDKANIQDRDHLEEHLRDQIDIDTNEKMDSEKMNFHFFKLHDYDDNSKLDGLEIMAALSHHNKANDKAIDDSDVVNTVDEVLKEDDLDGDGYLDYTEFLRSQGKQSSN